MLTLLNYTINKLIENYCWLLIKNNFKKKQLAEGKKNRGIDRGRKLKKKNKKTILTGNDH